MGNLEAYKRTGSRRKINARDGVIVWLRNWPRRRFEHCSVDRPCKAPNCTEDATLFSVVIRNGEIMLAHCEAHAHQVAIATAGTPVEVSP